MTDKWVLVSPRIMAGLGVEKKAKSRDEFKVLIQQGGWRTVHSNDQHMKEQGFLSRSSCVEVELGPQDRPRTPFLISQPQMHEERAVEVNGKRVGLPFTTSAQSGTARPEAEERPESPAAPSLEFHRESRPRRAAQRKCWGQATQGHSDEELGSGHAGPLRGSAGVRPCRATQMKSWGQATQGHSEEELGSGRGPRRGEQQVVPGLWFPCKGAGEAG